MFTNFTQDHLDYHGDMDAYWQAKAQLFAWPGLRAAVVNVDDAQGVELADALGTGARRLLDRARRAPSRAPARARASATAATASPSTSSRASERVAVATPLIGDYNVANLLGVDRRAARARRRRWPTPAPRARR